VIVFSPIVPRGKPKQVSERFLKFCEYIQKLRKAKNLSTGDIERQSGGTVSDATVTKLENKVSKSMELDTLEALAKGLQEPLINLLEAFYGYEIVPRENQYSLKDLTPSDREFVDSVLSYLLAGMKQDSLYKVRPKEYLIEGNVEGLLKEKTKS
jgi:transcriptional regulator with XRE-family HTH domain